MSAGDRLQCCPRCHSTAIVQVDGLASPTEWRCNACSERFPSSDIYVLERTSDPVCACPSNSPVHLEGCPYSRAGVLNSPTESPRSEGKISPDDEHEINVLVSSNETHVKVEFGKPVPWLAWPKKTAIDFAMCILMHCGVNIEIRHTSKAQGG